MPTIGVEPPSHDDRSDRRSLISNGTFLRGLVLFVVMAFVCLSHPQQSLPDSDEYRQIANGHLDQVDRPFADRLLHPLTVRLASTLTGSGVDVAFIIIAAVAYAVLIVSVASLTVQSLTVFTWLAMMATPLLCAMLSNIYLPDLFHAALIGVFLLALQRRMIVISLILLLALQVARESTVLLAVVLAAIAVYRRQWSLAAGSVAMSLLGVVIVAAVNRGGPSNIHHLNGLAYLVAKVPANAGANIFGIIPWTNTFATHFPNQYLGTPLWKVGVPGWLPMGDIRELGVYRLTASRPLFTAMSLFTTFGVLPSVVWMRSVKERARIFDEPSLAITVALVYGLIAFVLAPTTGVSVGRLMGYGWTAFWIATPVLFGPLYRSRTASATVLWCVQIICSWLPIVMGPFDLTESWRYAIIAAVAAILHVVAWRQVPHVFASMPHRVGR